jgi:hypothetical protein
MAIGMQFHLLVLLGSVIRQIQLLKILFSSIKPKRNPLQLQYKPCSLIKKSDSLSNSKNLVQLYFFSQPLKRAVNGRTFIKISRFYESMYNTLKIILV